MKQNLSLEHADIERGQQSFLELRVFDPNAFRYLNKSLQQCHVINEQENKRAHNERVLQIEHGLFTPLFFSIYGSMGRKCRTFFQDYPIYCQRNVIYQNR